MTAANFSVNKDVMNDVSLFATSTDYVKTDSCDIVDELSLIHISNADKSVCSSLVCLNSKINPGIPFVKGIS